MIDFPILRRFVSSAKWYVQEVFIEVWKLSLMYRKNKRDPRTESWETPCSTVASLELKPSIETYCWRSLRWDLNHDTSFDSIVIQFFNQYIMIDGVENFLKVDKDSYCVQSFVKWVRIVLVTLMMAWLVECFFLKPYLCS